MTTVATTPAQEILRIEDLHVHFEVRRGDGSRAVQHAVDGVSLALHKGETLGLVGESGCGKSTLARTILGIESATSGRVLLNGEDLTRMSGRQWRTHRPKLQVVFQDPYSSLDPRWTVQQIVAEPLRINRRYRRERIPELLSYVSMTPYVLERRPGEFSGGQRQRIAIARALALEPELLILDEPLSALDVSIQAQVINVLKRLRSELGLTYLFIAHDLSVVRYLSHRVAVMYLGRIVETGTRDEVFDSPRHPYTLSLLSAVPVARPAGREERWQRRRIVKGELPDPLAPPSGCTFRTRCPRAQQRCADQTPTLADGAAGDHGAACFFPGPD